MPKSLIGLLKTVNYKHAAFLDTLCTVPDLRKYDKTSIPAKKDKALLALVYYTWLVYLTAALLLLVENLLASVIVLIFLPVLVAGVLYIILYFGDLIREPSIKRFLGYDFSLNSKPKTKKKR